LGSPLRFPVLAYLLVLGAIFTLAIQLDTVQGDTWWALRAGKDMWITHRVIRTDSYSYTAYGDPWPDHAWLYQVLLYGVYVIGKLPLVSVVNAAIATAAVAIARPPGRVTWANLVAMTPVIALVSLSWAVRPQVVSLLMLAVIIRLIHRERWRTIVAVMLLWANLHAGVVLGGLVLGGATMASLLAWLIGRRASAERGRALRARFVSLIVTSVAAAGATLINPMGWGLWRYIATSSRRPGEEWIAEWQPSWTAPWLTAWFWVWSGLLLLLLLLRWRRLLQWPVLLGIGMALALTPLAWMSMRNISPFGIVTLPLVVSLMQRRAVLSLEVPVAERPGSVMPGAKIMVGLASIAMVVSVVRTLQSPASLGWYPMSSEIAHAIESCPGQVFTTYNGGAYLIWFTPGKKVFVDNRQDPFSADILNAGVGQGDWTKYFDRYGIKCAALNLMADPQQIVELGALRGWPIVHADSQWVVLISPDAVPAGTVIAPSAS